MSRRPLPRLRALLGCLAALAAAGCADRSAPAPMGADSILLTYASPYPAAHPFSQADQAWMDHVTRASDGRVRFVPFWSGVLLSSDMSMTEIRHGVADVGLITPIYARGGAHLLRAQSGFYGGVRSIEEQVRVYDCLAGRFPEFGRELEGLVVLAVQGGNFPGVVTRTRPIRHLSDFRGLRLRAQSDAVDVLRALGADPVNMPMADVYSAMAKGVIDGVVAPADTIRSLHFSEVGRFFTAIHFPRGAYPARAIAAGRFSRLPPDVQALLLQSRPFWEAELARNLLIAEQAGADFGREDGMTFSRLPAGEQARFDALYQSFSNDQARALQRFGIDGRPILAAAQAAIRERTCPAENAS
ncbi:MAG: TRAP transporter substrate-binding protein DctP [Allosphingosinicella sp.]